MAEEKKEAKKPAVKKAAAAKTPSKAEGKKPAAASSSAKAAGDKKKAAVSKTPSKAEGKRPVVKAAVKAAESTKASRREKKAKRGDGYVYAIGRRKRAIAQVKLWVDGKGEITVNGMEFKKYLPTFEMQAAVLDPLQAVGMDKANVEAKVLGGGTRGQAGAIRLGIARALLIINPEFRASLKKQGMLTRDPREKERKKPGLKKARKAPQWAKR